MNTIDIISFDDDQNEMDIPDEEHDIQINVGDSFLSWEEAETKTNQYANHLDFQ